MSAFWVLDLLCLVMIIAAAVMVVALGVPGPRMVTTSHDRSRSDPERHGGRHEGAR